jgi:hypothetical protein
MLYLFWAFTLVFLGIVLLLVILFKRIRSLQHDLHSIRDHTSSPS